MDERDRLRELGEDFAARIVKPILRMNGGWMYVGEVASSGGIKEREVQLARQFSGGAIIFGQKGIRLYDTATPEEVRRCCASARSQIAEMEAYVRSVERYEKEQQ
jgi:hypothetical protein